LRFTLADATTNNKPKRNKADISADIALTFTVYNESIVNVEFQQTTGIIRTTSVFY